MVHCAFNNDLLAIITSCLTACDCHNFSNIFFSIFSFYFLRRLKTQARVARNKFSHISWLIVTKVNGYVKKAAHWFIYFPSRSDSHSEQLLSWHLTKIKYSKLENDLIFYFLCRALIHVMCSPSTINISIKHRSDRPATTQQHLLPYTSDIAQHESVVMTNGILTQIFPERYQAGHIVNILRRYSYS